jgi:CDP-diacylglycerol--glycerol-3-phosphate 3-phosphatidyltransferase
MTQISTPSPAPPATAYRWLWWTTPNQLTLARIAAVPVLIALVYWNGPVTNVVAVAVFLLACLTDYWDGNLARARHEVTDLGKLLDPIADKILITASLVMLVSEAIADPIPSIAILVREFAVSGLRQVAALDGVAIAAVRGAKAKTIMQMLAVGFLLWNNDPFGLPFTAIGRSMLWISAVWTVWTGYTYFADYYSAKGIGWFRKR